MGQEGYFSSGLFSTLEKGGLKCLPPYLLQITATFLRDK